MELRFDTPDDSEFLRFGGIISDIFWNNVVLENGGLVCAIVLQPKDCRNLLDFFREKGILR